MPCRRVLPHMVASSSYACMPCMAGRHDLCAAVRSSTVILVRPVADCHKLPAVQPLHMAIIHTRPELTLSLTWERRDAVSLPLATHWLALCWQHQAQHLAWSSSLQQQACQASFRTSSDSSEIIRLTGAGHASTPARICTVADACLLNMQQMPRYLGK